MRAMYIEPGEGAIPHRVYDMSIEDVNERRQKSLVFPTAQKAAQYMGIPSHRISERGQPGTYVYSKKHNKKFAVRIEKVAA